MTKTLRPKLLFGFICFLVINSPQEVFSSPSTLYNTKLDSEYVVTDEEYRSYSKDNRAIAENIRHWAIIEDTDSLWDYNCDSYGTSHNLEQIHAAFESNCEGVIFYLQKGHGGLLNNLTHEVSNIRRMYPEKPVIVVGRNLCSAAYNAACALTGCCEEDRIFVTSEESVVGSIGAIHYLPHKDEGGVVVAGALKGSFNTLEVLKETVATSVQRMHDFVLSTRGDFLNLDLYKKYNIDKSGAVSGHLAVKIGLVDGIASLSEIKAFLDGAEIFCYSSNSFMENLGSKKELRAKIAHATEIVNRKLSKDSGEFEEDSRIRYREELELYRYQLNMAREKFYYYYFMLFNS